MMYVSGEITIEQLFNSVKDVTYDSDEEVEEGKGNQTAALNQANVPQRRTRGRC
jgi:hypothetical protein